MAEQRMSLFGLTPDQVRMARQQQAQKRQDELFAANLAGVKGDIPGFATGYAIGGSIGRNLGQAVTGLFGQELKDPELERATKMQSLVKEFEGMDFNDPATLQRIAVRMQEAGLYEESMNVFDRSLAIQTKQAELASKNKPRFKSFNLTDITKIGEIADRQRQAKNFLDTWRDDFITPLPFTGNLREMTVKTWGGGPTATAAVNWWRGYQQHKNKVRNTLFGGALTPTEKTEFDKESLDASVRNTKIIRATLEREYEIAKNAWERLSKNLEQSGYDPETIAGFSRDALEDVFANDPVAKRNLERLVEQDELKQTTRGPLRDGYNFGDEVLFSGSYQDFLKEE